MHRPFPWALIATVLLLLLVPFAALAQDSDAPAGDTTQPVAVGLYINPPFVMLDEADAPTGMAVDIWERLARDLDLESDYTFYDSISDVVTAAATGDIDVAVTNLTITRDRAEILGFTQPWFDAGMRIMVTEQHAAGIGGLIDGLSAAGHLRVYGWMLLAVLAATIALTLFDRRFDPKYPKRWRDGLAEGFYTVMSVATSGRPPSRSNLCGWFGRVWAAIWLVCGIGVLAYVTSTVTSVMTTLAITGTINGPADLPGKTVGVFAGSVSEDLAETVGLSNRTYPGIEEASIALTSGEIDAVVADAPVLEYYAHAHADPELGLEVVGPIFAPDKYGFALPLASDLRRPLTVALLALREDGVIEELRANYFGDRFE